MLTHKRWPFVIASAIALIAGGAVYLALMYPQAAARAWPGTLFIALKSNDTAAKITIPEGLRKEQIATILSSAGFGDAADISRIMNDDDLLQEFGVPTQGAAGQAAVEGGLDGYLFPDTYEFPAGTTVLAVLRRLRAQLDVVIDTRLQERMSQLGWTLHQTLTLAAIIEKETAAADERSHISSVFHNRIKKRMKMQTDPTVIYGMPQYDGHIRKSDLKRDHPYNTYMIAGLPPGPICQPGLAAIKAALYPSQTEDLFFVAMGRSGRHEFCANLGCHNAAVKRWLR